MGYLGDSTLGKTFGFQHYAQSLWKLSEDFQLLDVDNGFFMVKFDQPNDREKVMEGGPWMIFDHYLVVQPWSPKFVSPTAKVSRALVWIRFPGLNLVFYEEEVIMTLAETVDKPLWVDMQNLARGRFAQACVEVDLDKPVVGNVCFQRFWHQVEYEGLHVLCGACGCYDHMSRQCLVVKPHPPPLSLRRQDRKALPVLFLATRCRRPLWRMPIQK